MPILHAYAHGLRRFLSQHLSHHSIKVLSFVIALMSCLSAGSIMLFSLYSASLRYFMDLTYLQINFIASLSAIGMYLCLPVLGYLADCYGPALLSLLSIWFFCPSYFVNAFVVRNPPTSWSLYVLAASFCFIGLATSSLYFSSLLTCAKSFPDHKGLAISLPVSCYGLSTLMGSQLMKLSYFKYKGDSDYLDLNRVFSFFSVLYLVMGVLNFLSNSIVSIELDVIFDSESTPLLNEPCDSDNDSLIPQRSRIEPQNHKSRYVAFLRDKSAWFLLVSMILNIGTLESFQNNLGSVIKNVDFYGANLSNQVSVNAAASTAIRLIMGATSDYISSPNRRYPVCRIWLLVFVILLGAVGQLSLASEKLFSFTIITILNGGSYGGLFTTYPAVVASIWGIDIMGSTWGSFMVAPAIGSVAFSLFYGNSIDSKCGILVDANQCLNGYFETTGVCLLVSVVIVLSVWRFLWWPKGFKLF